MRSKNFSAEKVFVLEGDISGGVDRLAARQTVASPSTMGQDKSRPDHVY